MKKETITYNYETCRRCSYFDREYQITDTRVCGHCLKENKICYLTDMNEDFTFPVWCPLEDVEERQ